MKKIIPVTTQAQYVQALIALLEHIQTEPAHFADDATLVASLKSQGNLCRMTRPEQGIFPVSLNTFKRYCQHHVPGGFGTLDRLRQAARSAIDKARSPGPAPRKNQKRLIEELRAENAQLILDNLLLTRLLQLSMQHSRYYATASGESNLVALHAKEQRELLDLLSCVRADVRGQKLEKIVHADPCSADPAVFRRS